MEQKLIARGGLVSAASVMLVSVVTIVHGQYDQPDPVEKAKPSHPNMHFYQRPQNIQPNYDANDSAKQGKYLQLVKLDALTP